MVAFKLKLDKLTTVFPNITNAVDQRPGMGEIRSPAELENGFILDDDEPTTPHLQVGARPGTECRVTVSRFNVISLLP